MLVHSFQTTSSFSEINIATDYQHRYSECSSEKLNLMLIYFNVAKL